MILPSGLVFQCCAVRSLTISLLFSDKLTSWRSGSGREGKQYVVGMERVRGGVVIYSNAFGKITGRSCYVKKMSHFNYEFMSSSRNTLVK